jgi:hypothetical protein
MANVLSSPLGNLGLELCFLTHKLFQKTGGHMLTTKIGKVVILPVRSDKPISQSGQIVPLDKFI